MAARFKTKKVTLSGSPISLETILGTTKLDYYLSTFTLRAGASNAGTVYWRDASAGQDGGYLDAQEASSFDLSGKFVPAADFWIDGTLNDTVYITVVG